MSDERKSLDDIEKDDRVWVGTLLIPHEHLYTVERLTPAQIILTGGQRYERKTGRKVGGVGTARKIREAATPEEIAEWEVKQVVAAQQRQAREVERQRHDELRRELYGLFAQRVRIEEGSEVEGKEWEVTFYLSTDGVRKLAQLIKGESF